jgi:hypothetical protein
MSVQAISGSPVSPYQPVAPAAQNGAQPTAQSASDPKVKRGGGHHHHKPQASSNASASAAASSTGGTYSPLTATAVTATGSSQSTADAGTDSGASIDVFA